METNENHSSDSTMESIKNLTEKDAKTFLNLIYAILKENEVSSEKLILNVLSIYEKNIPRVVRSRQEKD